jgi:predicted DNA-binding transcriptional regulator AlpA
MVTEAAIEAQYGIPRRTLQRWRFESRGPRFFKFGRSVRYDLRDVEKWVDAQPTGGIKIR